PRKSPPPLYFSLRLAQASSRESCSTSTAGRFKPSDSWDSKRTTALDNRPRSEELRTLIEEAIISGEFSPGARLEEQELAQRYNVSRTPIRETLRLLASSGL